MLTARNEAPVRLLTAAEVRRSGSVRIGAGTGVGRATAVETVCIAPSTARMAVPSKTVRRCCNIKNPNCPVFRCGHPGGQGLTPDVGDVRNFRAVLWIADFRGFSGPDCAFLGRLSRAALAFSRGGGKSKRRDRHAGTAGQWLEGALLFRIHQGQTVGADIRAPLVQIRPFPVALADFRPPQPRARQLLSRPTADDVRITRTGGL